MPVLALILAFFIVLALDFRSLLKTNHKVRTWIIYFGLLSIGFLMSLLQAIDKAPPSPVVLIEKVVRMFIN
ncbi:MAG: hypothetical protein K0R93_260 [Anaerosolibacter sp.]|uniref:hypothetical protein n=1 Tax=Anaerosolibacter sp. TaxID=1872527 RepID=UPI00260AF78B|nr:hypothetical protein [Anaerosolibacter sp.]MDF2545362.1 hypothetical protein [Anaerosolibacter sp.]